MYVHINNYMFILAASLVSITCAPCMFVSLVIVDDMVLYNFFHFSFLFLECFGSFYHEFSRERYWNCI